MLSRRGARGVTEEPPRLFSESAHAELSSFLRGDMFYIGPDIHKETISYCVKDAAGCVHRKGKIGSSRRELDG